MAQVETLEICLDSNKEPIVPLSCNPPPGKERKEGKEGKRAAGKRKNKTGRATYVYRLQATDHVAAAYVFLRPHRPFIVHMVKTDFVYLIAAMPGRHSGDQVHKVKKTAAPLFLFYGCRASRTM